VNPKLVGIIVLVSTVLTELGIGYTILSGASGLLGPQHNTVSVPNPAFEALTARKDALKRELFEIRFLRVRAEGYLARIAALRNGVRFEALADLGRAEEIFMQSQTAGLAVGIAAFFKLPEDES
jgi:hypothetical protein